MASTSPPDVEVTIPNATIGSLATYVLLEADVETVEAVRAERGSGVRNHALVEGY